MALHNNLKPEKGALMVEASIGFLVLFLVVFAILEFARYATLNAVLQSAADEALALAQTVPGLDSSDPAAREGTGSQKGAKPAIREVGTRLATKTFFAMPGGSGSAKLVILDQVNGSPVSISMVEPSGASDNDEQRRKMLEENPIHIRLEAEVNSIASSLLFGPTFKVTAEAIGYREPRNPFSEPSALDCKGNPLEPGVAAPTDCACPTDPSNPDVTYNPALSKCVCKNPASVFVAARNITTGAEWGLTYNPSSKTCDCPPPWVMRNGKCECGLTDTMCESASHSWDSNHTPFGPGAHVRTWDFYYPTCECVPPCNTGSTSNWFAVADSTWDAFDQRCECAAPADIQGTCRNALTATYPGWSATYSGNFAVTEACECRTCGLGSQLPFNQVLTERYTFGCDCSTAPACPDGSSRTNWASCACLCGNGADFVQLPNGTIKCGAPGCNQNRNCYFDPGSGEVKVCESGGLCPSPLPYVQVP